MSPKKTTPKKAKAEQVSESNKGTAKPATEAKKATEKKTAEKKPRAKQADGKLSAIDAAAKVLGESKEPMTTKEMIEAMAEKNLWKSPGGQTPAATLYSAILREISKKGEESRFVKTERGKFKLAAN